MKGRVIKGVASRYVIETDGVKRNAVARKKLKDDKILIGDFVEYSEERGSCVIEKVLPRKNSLIRPYIANVDACLIVVAPVPEPDFLLVDKIIVNCLHEDIKPILVANKLDVGNIEELRNYFGIVDIYSVSASSGEGIDELLNTLSGKTVCFAGQSAVGKSSIINAFLKSDALKTDGLSKKIQRGKHTTRHAELLTFLNCSLIDTCGFSMLETVDIKYNELNLFYDEFELLRGLCRFKTCTHTTEPDCAVKSEVSISVSKSRYDRYVQIFNELKEKEEKKFG